LLALVNDRSERHSYCRLEVALLLIIYIAYGYTKGGSSSFILLTISSWILVISWLFAPYIFNPSGFEWQKYVYSNPILNPFSFKLIGTWNRNKMTLDWEGWQLAFHTGET
jgi:hypothetical protein